MTDSRFKTIAAALWLQSRKILLHLFVISLIFQPTFASAQPAKGQRAVALKSNRVESADRAGCPFAFRSDMPSDTFCVYRGTAYSARGEPCATDVVAIWSSYSTSDRQRTSGTRELFVGFVGQPELVLRAQVNQGRDNRAEVVEATIGETLPAERMSGSAMLDRVHRDGDTLRVAVDNSEIPADEGCVFASYVGSVIGTVGPQAVTTRR